MMSYANNKHTRGRRVRTPLALIAHRGYPARFPENTLPGFAAAVAAGAFFVEADVQLSADGVPVLYHDRSLQRMSRRSGSIHEYTAAQLARFRSFDFEKFGYKFAQTRIPHLAEFAKFLAENEDITAFVELKRISLERFGCDTFVAAVIQELTPVSRQCVIISYSLDALSAVREHGWQPIGAVVDRWRDRNSAGIRALQPEYLFCSIAGLSAWGRMRYKYGQLAVFETSDIVQARRLAKRGVNFIETDRIAEMQHDLSAIDV